MIIMLFPSYSCNSQCLQAFLIRSETFLGLTFHSSLRAATFCFCHALLFMHALQCASAGEGYECTVTVDDEDSKVIIFDNWKQVSLRLPSPLRPSWLARMMSLFAWTWTVQNWKNVEKNVALFSCNQLPHYVAVNLGRRENSFTLEYGGIIQVCVRGISCLHSFSF